MQDNANTVVDGIINDLNGPKEEVRKFVKEERDPEIAASTTNRIYGHIEGRTMFSMGEVNTSIQHLADLKKLLVENLKHKLASHNAARTLGNTFQVSPTITSYGEGVMETSEGIFEPEHPAIAITLKYSFKAPGTDKVKEETLIYPYFLTYIGMESETVDSFVQKEEQIRNSKYAQQVSVNTQDRTIDSFYMRVITNDVRETLRDYDIKESNCLEGFMFSELSKEASIEEIASVILNRTVKMFYTHIAKTCLCAETLNLAVDLRGNLDQKVLMDIQTKSALDSDTSYAPTGDPVRADFKVRLYKSSEARGNYKNSLNNGSGRDTDAIHTMGYIEGLPTKLRDPRDPNREIIRMVPNVILTNIESISYDIEDRLMGVINGIAILDKAFLYKPLLANIDINVNGHNVEESPNSPGVFNMWTDIAGIREKSNGKEQPSAIKLTDKGKSTVAARAKLLDQMFLMDNPVLSLDISPFGMYSDVDSAFIVAAVAGNPDVREAARRDIIDACVRLTNGNFPANFDTRLIFESVCRIPLGYFNLNGYKDIRTVDLAFVLNRSNKNERVVMDWLQASRQKEYNVDAFSVKAGVYKALGLGNARITAFGTRVTFCPEFVDALFNAARKAGFSPLITTDGIELENNDVLMPTFSTAMLKGDFLGYERVNAFNNLNRRMSYQGGINEYGYTTKRY